MSDGLPRDMTPAHAYDRSTRPHTIALGRVIKNAERNKKHE